MSIENLKTLRRYLAEKVAPKIAAGEGRFDMGSFGYPASCGFAGCMIGWGTFCPALAGIPILPPVANFHYEGGYEAIGLFFGLGFSDAVALFGGATPISPYYGGKDCDKVTLADGIAAIDTVLAEHGEVAT